MRSTAHALATAIWIGALSRSLCAYADSAPQVTEDEHEFEDETLLAIPAAKPVVVDSDGFSLPGLRSSAVRLELESRHETGASVVALLALDVSRSSFARDAPSWVAMARFCASA